MNVYDNKTNRCYTIPNGYVGTRNRATVLDIYGNKERRAITNAVYVDDSVAPLIKAAERIVRGKHKMTNREREIVAAYRAWKKQA